MRLKTKTVLATGLVGLTLIATTIYAEDAKVAAPAPAAATKDAAPTDTSKVVATVNGQPITQQTLDMVVDMVGRSVPDGKVEPRKVLDDLIITELARQEATKSGLAERADVKEKVKEFTDKLALNIWTQEKVDGLKISDEELKAAYDKQVASDDKFEYKARHILMKTKEEAEGIIKDLEKGADFADLAKKSSDGPSAGMGGDLGWFRLSTMVKPFADAVAKMQPNTYTKEPVQSEFGWHVIKLEEKRDVKPPEFETLKPQLQRQLQQEKMLAYMQEVRNKADVKVMLPEEKAPEAKPAASTDAKPAEAAPTPAADAKPAETAPAPAAK